MPGIKITENIWGSMFTNKISNNGYGVQKYSVAYLKQYARFSKEKVLNVSIQEESLSFEFPYKLLNFPPPCQMTHYAVTTVKGCLALSQAIWITH